MFCLFQQPWYRHKITRIIAILLLCILLPLSLKIALMPLDHIVLGFQLSDKILHFVAFFGFAALIHIALPNRNYWYWNGIPMIAYGALIEILQAFTPMRSFSGWDWFADILGTVAFWWLLKQCDERVR